MRARNSAQRLHRRAQFLLTMVLATAAFPLVALEALLWLGTALPGTPLAALAQWCGAALFMPRMWLSSIPFVAPPAFLLTWSVARRLVATGRVEHQLSAVTSEWPEPFGALVNRLGITDRVKLLPVRLVDVRTVGLLRPMIVCTTGLLETVTPAEFEAILQHELYHIRCRDPLKVLLGRAVVDGFFWLPVIRTLLQSFEAAKEQAADAWTVLTVPSEALLSALVKMLHINHERSEARTVIATAPFTGLAASRLTFLLEGTVPAPGPTIEWRQVWYTVAVSVTLWGFLFTSCAAVHY